MLPADFEQMKAWLGHGEVDIDLMIRMGAMTATQVVTLCQTLVDSPWFQATRPT